MRTLVRCKSGLKECWNGARGAISLLRCALHALSLERAAGIGSRVRQRRLALRHGQYRVNAAASLALFPCPQKLSLHRAQGWRRCRRGLGHQKRRHTLSCLVQRAEERDED
jgi:hypothetical protein